MIVQPIVLWTWGQTALQRGLSLAVLVQAATVLAILGEAWGFKRTAGALAVVALTSFLAEWIGNRTGFPFGSYHYTDVLQPQLAGVPLLIPLAWMMMLPPAWAVAQLISKKEGRDIRFVLLAALGITLWDLFLDPQMVGWNFWVWEFPGLYFGIPLVNFMGWLLVSALITWLVGPRDLPTGPLMAVYVITWLLQTIGQGLFWAQPGPALFGFLGMGTLVFLAWRPALVKGRGRLKPRTASDSGGSHAE
jgi:putative membrane protein